MEAFKRKLKARVVWLAAAMLGIAAIYFILLFWGDRLSSVPAYGKEFVTGAFIGLIAVLLAYIIRTVSYLGSEEKIQGLYIKENDERRCLILQKTGSLGFRLSGVGLGFAAIIAGFFNLTVSLSLVGAILFLVLVKLGLRIYYERRY